MKTIFILLFALLPVWVSAAEFPAFYDVTGVASNDTLNVRAGPRASEQKLAELGPYQRNIEIIGLSADRKWGLLNSGERSGWASMRYLARQAGQNTGGLPRPLSCSGTEPFWALDIGTGSGTVFTLAGEADQPLTVHTVTSAAGRPDKYGLVAGGPGGTLAGIVSVAICSDGMSDRTYGLSIDMIVGTRQYSGCCMLVP